MLAPFLLMTLSRQSPAKINLLLNILGKRPDGFHELETVMQPVALWDELTFERKPAGVRLSCSHPALPVDASNLVHRAATGFLTTAGINEGVSIRLEKRVPLAAGLGGGSSNAAHALLGLNALFGEPLSGAELARLAAGLGSDVPFFLQDQPAVATGRGEIIQPQEPFAALRGLFLLLIHPGFGVSTAWAYQHLGRYPRALQGERGRAGRLVAALQAGDPSVAARDFYNSLEMPVFAKYPILELFQEFLRERGAVATLMSGSGSSTFALGRDRREAEQLRAGFLERFGESCWTAVLPL
jgi:4-diphosphocytidyl-2-C-methyl-D-erythritol kinase